MSVFKDSDDAKHLVEAMHDWYGITVTEEFVEKVAATEPRFVTDVDICSVDTVAREWFVDLVGKHLGIEGRWPLNMDGPAYAHAYFMEFKRRAGEAGIVLHGNMWKGIP